MFANRFDELVRSDGLMHDEVYVKLVDLLGSRARHDDDRNVRRACAKFVSNDVPAHSG